MRAAVVATNEPASQSVEPAAPVKKIVGDTVHITNLAKDVTGDDLKVSSNPLVPIVVIAVQGSVGVGCVSMMKLLRRTIEEPRAMITTKALYG